VIRAVCLDIDDTLVDFTTAATGALDAVLGTAVDTALWARVNELHYGRYLAGEVDFPGMQHARLAAIFAEMGLAAPADVAALEVRRAAELRNRLCCFDDVLPCLDELRKQGLALAVLTNSDGPHQRAKLDAVGLGGYFDQLVISGESGCAKPSVEIFQLACRMLGTEPWQTLHVGDRLYTDALGAKDADLHGVWLDRGGSRCDALVGVHRLRSLDELPELVRSLSC